MRPRSQLLYLQWQQPASRPTPPRNGRLSHAKTTVSSRKPLSLTAPRSQATGRPAVKARRRLLSTTGPWIARHDVQNTETARPQRLSRFRKLLRSPALFRATGKPFVSLPTVCAAMGSLVLALIIWRVDVVRLLPQTAMFYKMVGLDVNLRGLMFKAVKISSETVER